MRMIFAFIVLISFKITEVKGECFLELLDKTFEHSDGIVGPKFHFPGTIGQTECLERCLNMYECIAMTYEFDSSTCRLFKFIPNTNIEKEKEINCQGRCITRYIALPKYCYDISNSIPVYVRFVNQLSDCYAFASLCKSNFKLQDRMRKLEEKIDAMDKVETITSSDGVYTGMTRNGKKHGFGEFIGDNGDSYFGHYKDDVKHGSGTYKWADGDYQMYVGNYENGEKHGYGVVLHSAGEMYSGEWVNGKRTGIGYNNWPFGHMYVGQYKDELRNGNGHYFWLNGNRYAGEWRDDKMHGNGIMMYPDGTKRKGQWRDDKQV